MKRSVVLSGGLLLALVSGLVRAGIPAPAPEPGTFELIALGGIVAAVIALRNRRKK
jgi:hypothetical protein